MSTRRLRTRAQRGLGPRPKTLRARVLERQVQREEEPLLTRMLNADDPPRPQKRGDCEPCPTCQDAYARGTAVEQPQRYLECGHRGAEALNHCRPCARVWCRHNLFLDVKEEGHLRMNFPGQELEQLKETCSLDVADAGRHTHEWVGDLVNMHRERVRQVEREVLYKIRAAHEDGEDT